jgi:uncharacterized protein YcbK (DUF882 family)
MGGGKMRDYSCKCGCGLNNIDKEIAAAHELIDAMYGEKTKLTSGCRCPKHNANSGGKQNSSHLKGKAIDLKPEKPTVFNLCRLAYQIGRAGVRRVGFNDKSLFFHIDNDRDKVQDVFFSY